MGDAGPRIALNGRVVEGLGALVEAMEASRPAADAPVPRVDLMIEKTVPYQDVIDLMDAVRDAGFGKFSLLTLAADVRLQRSGTAAPGPPAG